MVPVGTVLLTFEGVNLPNRAFMGFQAFTVKPYMPTPFKMF